MVLILDMDLPYEEMKSDRIKSNNYNDGENNYIIFAYLLFWIYNCNLDPTESV
jgi:hypothetical protein